MAEHEADIGKSRNRTIMKMFNLIHVGERAGSGVPNIFSIWNDEGWITPEVEELYQPDRTILKLSFVCKNAYAEQKSAIETHAAEGTTQAAEGTTQAAEGTTQAQENILLTEKDILIIQLLRQHPNYSKRELANALSWKIDLVSYYINKLKTKGIIERKGTSQHGIWIVNYLG